MENTNPVYQYAEQDANTYLSNADYSYGHALANHQQQVKMLEEQKELKPWFAARLSTPELSSSLPEHSTQFSLDFDDSSLGSSLGSSLDSSWQGSDSVLDHSGFVGPGSLFHGSSPNPTENVPASYQASGSYAPQDIQMQIKSLEQGFFDFMEAPTFVKPEPRNKTWNLLEDTAGARSPTPSLSFTSTASSWSSRSLVSSFPSQVCSFQPSPQDPSRFDVAPALEYTAKAQPKSNPSAGRRYVRNGDTHKETRRHKQTPSVFCTTKMQIREGRFYFCEHETCQYAVKGFKRRGNLLRHIRSVHGEKHGRIKQPNPHRTKAKSNDSRETARQRQSLLTAADLEAIDGKCRSIQAFRTRPEKGVQLEHLHGQQSSQSAPRAENFDENMHISKSSALAPVVTTDLQSDSSSETENSCDDTDFTDSSFPDSPNSAQRTNIVRPVLSPLKLDLVNRVMVEFYRLFDANFGIRRHEDGAGEGGSQDMPIEERSQKTSDGTSGPGGQKRKNRDDGSSPPDGGNDDPNKRRKRDPGTPASKLPGGRKLACPFFKYNPSGHSTNRACVYPGFPSISRVKEHLYRNHTLPIQCPRCCQTFSNDEDCLQHQRAQRGCEWKEGALLEGVSKAQEAKLRSKKRSTSSLPDEARWKVIYRILFPQVADDQIPSAYFDFTSLQECTPSTSPNSPEFVRFEDFSRKKLPELVRTSLEVLVEQNTQMQLLEETLKSQLIDIVRDSQEKLFSMYQDARSIDSSTPTTAAVSSEDLQRTIDRQSTANPSQTELAEVFMPPPLVHGLSNGPDLKEIQQGHQAKPENSKDQSDSGYGSANTSFGSSESFGAPQSSDTPAEIEPLTIDTLKAAAKPNENSEPQIATAHSQSPSITQSDRSPAPLGSDQPNSWEMLPEFDTSLLDPMILDYFPNSDYNWAWNVDGENNSFTTSET